MDVETSLLSQNIIPSWVDAQNLNKSFTIILRVQQELEFMTITNEVHSIILDDLKLIFDPTIKRGRDMMIDTSKAYQDYVPQNEGPILL